MSIEKFVESNKELIKQYKMACLLKSPHLLERVSQKINHAYKDFSNLPVNPFSDEVPLEYVVGNIVVGHSALNPNVLIKSDLENLSGHILSIGATGSGKTHWTLTILHQIISQYKNTNLRVIVFASKKSCEQRNLIVNNPPGACIFLDKNTLALNPIASIKGIEDEITISDTARIISNELGLMAGGQLYLQDNFHKFLLSNKGDSFLSFIKWISQRTEKSFDLKGYHDRLVVRLNSLMFEAKSIFDCFIGIDEKHLITNNLVIELPFSSTFMMSVVSGLILSRIFRYKSVHSEFLQYKNLIVLEDIQGAMRNV